MDYSKIQEPCFVCRIEDNLYQERGTQSHPINCGWRLTQEHTRYLKALEQIIDICYDVNNEDSLTRIKNIAITTLVSGVKNNILKGEV